MPNNWNERGDFSEQLVRIIRLKLRRGEGGLVNGKEKKDGRINRERGWPPFLLTTLFTFLRFSPVHKSPTADHKIVVFAPTGQRCSRPRDESVLGEGRGAQAGCHAGDARTMGRKTLRHFGERRSSSLARVRVRGIFLDFRLNCSSSSD